MAVLDWFKGMMNRKAELAAAREERRANRGQLLSSMVKLESNANELDLMVKLSLKLMEGKSE